jgi:hypothetical protein
VLEAFGKRGAMLAHRMKGKVGGVTKSR